MGNKMTEKQRIFENMKDSLESMTEWAEQIKPSNGLLLDILFEDIMTAKKSLKEFQEFTADKLQGAPCKKCAKRFTDNHTGRERCVYYGDILELLNLDEFCDNFRQEAICQQ